MIGFYINLPIGAAVLLFLALLLETPTPPAAKSSTLKQHIKQLDPLGTVFFLPGTTLLLLALQWGGTTYPWSSARVVASLVLASVFLLCFIAVQIVKKDTATVPPRILTQRSIASAVWYTFTTGASMQIVLCYVPIWFQAIQGVSAVNSGIRTLALVIPMVIASGGSGIVCNRIGLYAPQMILGSVIMSVGAGMLTTWDVHASSGKWIGYQVLYGFGMGLGFQAPNMAVQTTLSRPDIPTGIALIFFSQMLGGAVMVSAAQNVFVGKLRDYLSGIPGVDAGALAEAGTTTLRDMVPPDILERVLEAFNRVVTKTFVVAVAVSAAGIIGATCVEWNNVKDGEGQAEKRKVNQKADGGGKA